MVTNETPGLPTVELPFVHLIRDIEQNLRAAQKILVGKPVPTELVEFLVGLENKLTGFQDALEGKASSSNLYKAAGNIANYSSALGTGFSNSYAENPILIEYGREFQKDGRDFSKLGH